MPKAYRMTWEQAKTRWRKMYKGKLYVVSCEQLKAPLPTKAASYRLANAWWEKKLAELTAPSPEQRARDSFKIIDLEERIARAQREIETSRRLMYELGYKPKVVKGHDLRTARLTLDGHADLDSLSQAMTELEGKPVQLDQSLTKQTERFLEIEKARGRKPRTHQDLTAFIHKAMRCPSLPEDASKISEQTISALYAWLRNDSGMAGFSQFKCFSFFKRFVAWLYGQRIIERPRNLDSRQFTFDTAAKAVKTRPVEEVRTMLKKLPDRLRLYAYLALNCAMLGIDMAMLRHDELKGDRIERKRTKTERHESTPVVSYLLWPETLALLNKYPRTHPEYVLTGKTGTPLVRPGKKGRTDLVGLQWRRGKVKIPLKTLRSHAADLLKEGGYDLQMQQVFLCHAPGTVAERHYVNYPQQKLDEAVTWLRVQYFS